MFSSTRRDAFVLGLVFVSSLLLTTTTAFSISTTASTASSSLSTTSALYSSNPSPQRKARRNLQKRRKKNKNDNNEIATPTTTTTTSSASSSSSSIMETVEIRPLISATAKEVGEDYWIDENELKQAKQRQEQIRKREPGQVTDEKLWNEVLSPYKNNWIGIFSVFIIILATLVTQFPELLQYPMITIPDL